VIVVDQSACMYDSQLPSSNRPSVLDRISSYKVTTKLFLDHSIFPRKFFGESSNPNKKQAERHQASNLPGLTPRLTFRGKRGRITCQISKWLPSLPGIHQISMKTPLFVLLRLSHSFCCYYGVLSHSKGSPAPTPSPHTSIPPFSREESGLVRSMSQFQPNFSISKSSMIFGDREHLLLHHRHWEPILLAGSRTSDFLWITVSCTASGFLNRRRGQMNTALQGCEC
jgi:hypothetical protein